MRPFRTPNVNDLLAERLDLSRVALGLRRTGILFEVRRAEAFVLLAPVDAAFDVLPWSFADLIHDPELLDARFALFEGLVALHTSFGAGTTRTAGGSELTFDASSVRARDGRRTPIASILPVRRGNLLLLESLPATLEDHLLGGLRATA